MKRRVIVRGFVAIFTVGAALCSSCGKRAWQREIEAFIGQTIVFPDTLQPVLDGRAVDNLNLLANRTASLVVWIDSLGCTSCALQHLDPWYEVIDYASRMSERFRVIFLLSPKRQDRHRIDRSTILFKYPMYIDRECRFEALNPAVPKADRLHVFLLDSANRVVLVGSPIGNRKLWELYKQQIGKLTGQNGAAK